jgi:hypothetical protein
MAGSVEQKFICFSKDNALPFMLFSMFDGSSLRGDWVRMEHPVFSTKILASRTRNAGGTAHDASPVFQTAIFFADGLQRCFRRRSVGAGFRSRRFAENPDASWPPAPFQKQQAGLKDPA